jgi:MarR family transcriptional regulator, organic hydroperoxide resistance regulator
VLERLERTGHLTLQESGADKLTTIVCLTEKSNYLKNDYQKVSMDMIELFYKGFTNDEISQFELYLKRILYNLNETEY